MRRNHTRGGGGGGGGVERHQKRYGAEGGMSRHARSLRHELEEGCVTFSFSLARTLYRICTLPPSPIFSILVDLRPRVHPADYCGATITRLPPRRRSRRALGSFFFRCCGGMVVYE